MTENPYQRWIGTDNDHCLPVMDRKKLDAILGATAARVHQELGTGPTPNVFLDLEHLQVADYGGFENLGDEQRQFILKLHEAEPIRPEEMIFLALRSLFQFTWPEPTSEHDIRFTAADCLANERRTTVNHAMKTARTAWNTVSRANPRVFPPKNPFEKMGLQSNSRETPHATFAELAAFRAKAIEMGYPSLATGALIGWELLQREAHMFIRFVAEHYRPPSRPNHVYVINYKTSTGSWEPLFNAKGKPLYPVLMAELDAIKELRPTGGLMLRRDGSSLPWFGKGEMLTQVQRISKKIILGAGLRSELTFTSFGRHGGTTEASTSGLTETQLMQKGQWSSTAAMAHYLHDDDEAKQDAQMKRIKRRAKLAKQATVK